MSIAPAIDPNDITPDLEQRHRDAMLDLVLTWGALDGALGVLLSCVRGLPLDQGAELIGRRPNLAKLAEVCKVLRNAPGGADAARIVEKHKKNYELRSRPPNRIAHSRCVGDPPPYRECAEHVQQLGGESPLSSLMAAKD